MSVYVSGSVWKHSRAKGGDLLVLLAIADIAGDDGIARPEWDTSIAKLSAKTRLSERAVQYCIRNLEALGELVVSAPTGRGRANVYQILLDRNRNLFDGPEEPAREQAVDKSDEGGATGFTPGVQSEAEKGATGCTRSVFPSIRKNLSPRARETEPDKKAPTAAERVKAWFERGLTTELREWAEAHGWSPFLDLHLEHFRDYLAQPKNQQKYVDLDAAFRNCVRADWGDVRRRAQQDAQFGRGVDLNEWWKSDKGVKAKGHALGLTYDAATYRMKFVERMPMARLEGGGERQWTPEEISMYGWREYEVAVLDLVVDREGWGAWVDPGKRTPQYRAVCRRRRARGADAPAEEQHA